MKLILAGSLPDQFAGEFVKLLHRFDQTHPGCVLQTISDTALPRDLRPIFEPFDLPVVDPRRFHTREDSD